MSTKVGGFSRQNASESMFNQDDSALDPSGGYASKGNTAPKSGFWTIRDKAKSTAAALDADDIEKAHR